MKFRVFLIALLCSLAARAQMRMTVDELVSFVRSSVQLKQDDKSVATYLHRVKMVQKLEDRTVEEMQSIGAGPKTLQALRDLRDASASGPTAPPPVEKPKPVPIPPPDSIEQQKVLSDARDFSLNYVQNLPNFICTQVTRRSIDPTGKDSWIRTDTITERLSFFEHHENYQVVLVNNTPSTAPHEGLNGAISSGEFGSILNDIFNPETETRFEWERWATLREHRMHVYSYHIRQYKSKYRIAVLARGEKSPSEIVTAYHGLIYVDRVQHRVFRITLDAEDLPPSFPIKEVHQEIDYDKQMIGDQEFHLPLRFVVRARQDERFLSKNEVEFHLYRKFGTESTIKFEPEPLPESKEQPPKQQ